MKQKSDLKKDAGQELKVGDSYFEIALPQAIMEKLEINDGQPISFNEGEKHGVVVFKAGHTITDGSLKVNARPGKQSSMFSVEPVEPTMEKLSDMWGILRIDTVENIREELFDILDEDPLNFNREDLICCRFVGNHLEIGKAEVFLKS